MVDGFESLREVNCGDDSALGRFALIEACGDEGGEGEKSGDGRATRSEAVLMWRAREVLKELWTDETFEEFGGWAEERNGTIRRGEVKGFARFRNREDKGVFPDSGKVSRVEGKVEEGGEEGEGFGTKVFEVKIRQVVRA